MSIHITSGALKGRGINVDPKTELRPTTGYGRQMVFNILGDAVAGCYFLDLYAGSGAVGFEAASRGAEQVVFVEQEPKAAGFIEANIERLGLDERCRVVCADATQPDLLDVGNLVFDIVFLDPPYALFPAPGLERMGRFLKPGGVLLYEYSSRKTTDPIRRFNLLDNRKAGDSAYSFFTFDKKRKDVAP